jgi:hypothetical protein
MSHSPSHNFLCLDPSRLSVVRNALTCLTETIPMGWNYKFGIVYREARSSFSRLVGRSCFWRRVNRYILCGLGRGSVWTWLMLGLRMGHRYVLWLYLLLSAFIHELFRYKSGIALQKMVTKCGTWSKWTLSLMCFLDFVVVDSSIIPFCSSRCPLSSSD